MVKSTTTKPSTKSKPSTKPQQKEVNVKPQLQPNVRQLLLNLRSTQHLYRLHKKQHQLLQSTLALEQVRHHRQLVVLTNSSTY
jgi:hypothetical protein